MVCAHSKRAAAELDGERGRLEAVVEEGREEAGSLRQRVEEEEARVGGLQRELDQAQAQCRQAVAAMDVAAYVRILVIHMQVHVYLQCRQAVAAMEVLAYVHTLGPSYSHLHVSWDVR